MKNKLPSEILTLQSIILVTLPRDLFDENGVWLHYRKLLFVNAAWSGWPFPGTVPKKIEQELVLRAGILLTHFSEDKSCKKTKWRNTDYCPDAPYGNYIWAFHCGMVQELIWLRDEFVTGFLYGSDPTQKHDRDASPYKDYGSRDRSWDKGCILGISWRWHPAKITAWIDKRKVAESI